MTSTSRHGWSRRFEVVLPRGSGSPWKISGAFGTSTTPARAGPPPQEFRGGRSWKGWGSTTSESAGPDSRERATGCAGTAGPRPWSASAVGGDGVRVRRGGGHRRPHARGSAPAPGSPPRLPGGAAVPAVPVPPVILTRHRRCPHKGGRDMLGAWRAKRCSPSEPLTARVPDGPIARAKIWRAALYGRCCEIGHRSWKQCDPATRPFADGEHEAKQEEWKTSGARRICGDMRPSLSNT